MKKSFFKKLFLSIKVLVGVGAFVASTSVVNAQVAGSPLMDCPVNTSRNLNGECVGGPAQNVNVQELAGIETAAGDEGADDTGSGVYDG
jgi:hypothetical protein